MELLLNILWLMLALPAIWLWRRDPACARSSLRLGYLCPVVLLGCILVLLFPVVSATDDLHAMRQEMEESSPSRRVVRQLGSDKSQSGLSGLGTSPAHVVCLSWFSPGSETCGLILTKPTRLPETAQLATWACRAPPRSQLS
jgi:hypothetical protein